VCTAADAAGADDVSISMLMLNDFVTIGGSTFLLSSSVLWA
jgi:hypothetical protein